MITKIALNAVKMRAPFLSEGSLKKLQDAGIIKSVSDLVPGWQEGSKNLAKRYNADITTLPENHPVINKILASLRGGGVTLPGGDVLQAAYSHTPGWVRKTFTRGFGKTIETLPENTPVIAYNSSVSRNPVKNLERNTIARHELLESKYIRDMRNAKDKTAVARGKSESFRTPEEQQLLETTEMRKRPAISVVKGQPQRMLSHMSANVLRGERNFLMNSGHPELARKMNTRKMRELSGEYGSFRKITGNDDLYGSMTKGFDAGKYEHTSNGALRKQLAHDDRSLRRYINKHELTSAKDYYINGNSQYTLPSDGGAGIMRELELRPMSKIK